MGSDSWFQRVQSAVIGIMGLSMISPVGVECRRLFNSWLTRKQRAGTSIYALPVNPLHMCVHVGMDTHAVMCMWKSEDSGQELVLSYPVASRGGIQVLWLGSKHLDPLSHLTGPPFPLFICPSTQPMKWCHHTHDRSSVLG